MRDGRHVAIAMGVICHCRLDEWTHVAPLVASVVLIMVCEVGVMIHTRGPPDASLVMHFVCSRKCGVLKDHLGEPNLAPGRMCRLDSCDYLHKSDSRWCGLATLVGAARCAVEDISVPDRIGAIQPHERKVTCIEGRQLGLCRVSCFGRQISLSGNRKPRQLESCSRLTGKEQADLPKEAMSKCNAGALRKAKNRARVGETQGRKRCFPGVLKQNLETFIESTSAVFLVLKAWLINSLLRQCAWLVPFPKPPLIAKTLSPILDIAIRGCP